MEENQEQSTLKELVEITRQRHLAQKEFEDSLLEELRALTRAIGNMQMRSTVGDL